MWRGGVALADLATLQVDGEQLATSHIDALLAEGTACSRLARFEAPQFAQRSRIPNGDSATDVGAGEGPSIGRYAEPAGVETDLQAPHGLGRCGGPHPNRAVPRTRCDPGSVGVARRWYSRRPGGR